ncbi:MAG: winged helix DNA-binding protein [Proteobacteria bacterium]|nr:winged helix DNA-binding protein [Pseudomonadota bacterium]
MPSVDPSPGAEPAADAELVPRLLTGLMRVGMLLRSDGLRRGRAVGLTPTQRQILLLLRTRRRPLRLAEVAGSLDLGSPTISAAVGALVRKGAVVREREPGDRRALALRLTSSGRALAAAPAWPPELRRAVAALPEAEQGALFRALVAVVRALEARGQYRTGAACLACQQFRAVVGCEREASGVCAWMGGVGTPALRRPQKLRR